MTRSGQSFSTRHDGVVVEELAGELLIYDRRTDVAHCLSDVAALAWRACEGGATVEAIAEELLTSGLVISRDEAAALAEAAVAELGEKDLFETPRFLGERVPRRQALRRLAGAGIAAATGPLVLSVAVPNAYAHASRASTCTQQIYFSGTKSGSTYYFAVAPSSSGNYELSSCNPITSANLPQSGIQGADYSVTATNAGVCADLRIQVSGSTYYVCSTDASWSNDVGASFLTCPNSNPGDPGCQYWGATSVDPPGEGTPNTGLAAVCKTEALMFTCGSGPQACVMNGYSCLSNDQCCSSNCHNGSCS